MITDIYDYPQRPFVFEVNYWVSVETKWLWKRVYYIICRKCEGQHDIIMCNLYVIDE